MARLSLQVVKSEAPKPLTTGCGVKREVTAAAAAVAPSTPKQERTSNVATTWVESKVKRQSAEVSARTPPRRPKKSTRRKSKKSTSVKKRKKRSTSTATDASPLLRPVRVSYPLSEIVSGSLMPRSEVTRRIWQYVRENGLKDPQNGRRVICDSALRRSLGCRTFGFCELAGLMSPQLCSVPLESLSRGGDGTTTLEQSGGFVADSKKECLDDAVKRETTTTTTIRRRSTSSAAPHSSCDASHRSLSEAELAAGGDVSGCNQSQPIRKRSRETVTSDSLRQGGTARGSTKRSSGGACPNRELTSREVTASGSADGTSERKIRRCVAAVASTEERGASTNAGREQPIVKSSSEADSSAALLSGSGELSISNESFTACADDDLVLRELRGGLTVDVWNIEKISCDLSVALMMTPTVFEHFQELPFQFAVRVMRRRNSRLRRPPPSPRKVDPPSPSPPPRTCSASVSSTSDSPQPLQTIREVSQEATSDPHPDFPQIPRVSCVIHVDELDPHSAYEFHIMTHRGDERRPPSSVESSSSSSSSSSRRFGSSLQDVVLMSQPLFQRSEPSKWSVSEACSFATSLRVPFLASKFHEFGVDGRTLECFTELDLTALGVSAPFLVRRTMDAVCKIFELTPTSQEANSC